MCFLLTSHNLTLSISDNKNNVNILMAMQRLSILIHTIDDRQYEFFPISYAKSGSFPLLLSIILITVDIL